MNNEDLLKRGDPKKFLKMNMSTLLIKMYYPTVLSDLYIKQGLEKANVHLNNIGDRAAKLFLTYYQPKADTPFKLIKEMSRFVGKSYKFKKISGEETYIITTKKCPLCHEMPEMDLPGIKNCEPIGGFINGFFNNFVPLKNPKNINYKVYRGKITKSKGSGDDICELVIKMEEGT
ncbi:MAG: hypothetical protein EAX96_16040 [Candidatus Lokiarchaeota archaeon]|nr:hypothetical protein [Candidatus Lokiarchaeota archaeon]